MQNLINLNNLDVVVDEATFRGMHPNVSFPKPMAPEDVVSHGYALFEYVLQPEPAWNEKVVALDPEPDAQGVFHQTWGLEALTGDALAAAQYAQSQRVMEEIVAREQYLHDAFAKTRGYDDIKSATGYAGCGVPKFDVDGTYCKNIRALRWAKLYEIMDEVMAGTRPMPSVHDDVEADLPPMVWPA